MRVEFVSPTSTFDENCTSQNNIDKYVVPTHLLYENDDETRFSEIGSFGRLHSELRNLIRRDAPIISARTIISTAVSLLFNARFARTGRIPRELFAFACADLAVTGKRAYFGKQEGDIPLTSIDFDELAFAIITDVQLTFPSAREVDIRSCITSIYERIFRVAWSLQGPPAYRIRFRSSLGWITVSGEDDQPHRPVNVFTSQYPQFNVNVSLVANSIRRNLPLRDININTRFIVASNLLPSSSFPENPTNLPPNASITIPPPVGSGRNIIVFIHGHSSRAEEFEDLAPLILSESERRGQPFIIISLDLPCAGYTDMFNSEEYISPLIESRNVDTTNPSGHFPGLSVMEEFICRFIETLNIEDRILAIIGGSLGGNLTLRLGRRSDHRSRFIRNIVSWSAASVWNSFLEPHHLIDELAKNLALDSATASMEATRMESSDPLLNDSARIAYFNNVFIALPLDLEPIYRIRRQPDHWYRDDWQFCKLFHIENSMLDRQEIYHQYFRQMHWRIALEQLIFSQNLRERGTPLYLSNRARTLLLAGEADNYDFTNIYNATMELARNMVDTEGRCILVSNTGHSIHNERPRWFTNEIINFLLYQ